MSLESKLALEHALGLLPPTAEDDDAGRDMSDVAIGRRLRDLRRARASLPLSNLSCVREPLPLSRLAFILGIVTEASLSRNKRDLCRPRGGWPDLLTDDYVRALRLACAKDLGNFALSSIRFIMVATCRCPRSTDNARAIHADLQHRREIQNWKIATTEFP
jgi:hypothetical protein